jgi:hypothetical protein
MESTSTASNLFHTGFETADRRRVLVIANPGEPRSCQVQLGDLAANVALEKSSLTTLVWS